MAKVAAPSDTDTISNPNHFDAWSFSIKAAADRSAIDLVMTVFP
jgi:hypothetical protein